MSVLDAVALSGGKTLHVEAHRINDLERVGMFTPPGNVMCCPTSRPNRLLCSRYDRQGDTAKVHGLRFHTAGGWGISLTQGAGIIGNGLSPLIEGAITARRKTKELTEKSHWGIV